MPQVDALQQGPKSSAAAVDVTDGVFHNKQLSLHNIHAIAKGDVSRLITTIAHIIA
jgi:hypothetical protein